MGPRVESRKLRWQEMEWPIVPERLNGRCAMTLERPAEFEVLPAEFAVALLVAAETADSSDDAIVSSRLDGTIMSWSPAAELLYGWTVAEAIGQNIEMIVPEAH